VKPTETSFGFTFTQVSAFKQTN